MNEELTGTGILKEIGFTLLSEGKILKIRAEGYSMYPAIKPGSVIHIRPYQPGELPEPGEIIAWKRESGLVVHRLVRIISEGNETLYITRGDGTLGEDPPVSAGQIAGRVGQIEYRGRNRILKSGGTGKPHYAWNRFRVVLLLKLKKIRHLIAR
ncbi:MAG: signal peptidase I [Bacteroidales bacterium]|nr:signal peptidase I [Bacteroidales bacterium]